MKTRIFLPWLIAAAGVLTMGLLAAFGQSLPPIPTTKLQSPKVAGSADTLNRSMAIAQPPLTVTNQGAVTANFEATKIQGLTAGFKYRTSLTNGAWKILGTVPYPTNGGPVSMNYCGTNIPAIYFKAFLQFPDPVP